MCSVSIIIPTYNCSEWIGRALRSVVSQPSIPTEIIVIDDGSGDDTRSVVAPWVATGQVRYIYQVNKGLPGARNAGARLARGRYLAFLDADDELAPGAIATMTEAMEHSGAAWCLIDIVRVSESNSIVQTTPMPPADPLFWILEDCYVRRGMFFRSLDFFDVGMYDDSIRMCEDWELYIRMFERQKSFVRVPEPLYRYTKREGSITTGRLAENAFYGEMVMRKHHKRLADAGDPKVRRLYADLMWKMSRRYLYSTHLPGAALRCAIESLRYDFDLRRALHPFAHLATRLVGKRREPVEM